MARARGEAALTLAERARLAGFRVAKRRDDWLLGRVAAKALAAAALRAAFPGAWPLRAIEIASEPGGRPYARLAPEVEPAAGFAPGETVPVAISISHEAGRALCAAACTAPDGGPLRQLGVDLCAVEPRPAAFAATFFTPDEERFVREAPAPERGGRATLVWCAKEAVLKALGIGLTVDTRAVSCRLGPGPVAGTGWPSPPAGRWQPFVAAFAPDPGRLELLPGAWCALPGPPPMAAVAAVAVHRSTSARPCPGRTRTG